MEPDFDVAVIGGGPAGSTAACYLTQAGLSVVVVEAEHFPRPHVGESLVPSTTPVLAEIGALKAVDAAGFLRKYGAAWTSGESRNIPRNGFRGLDHDFKIAEVQFVERDQQGVDRDYTYHVDRAKFDSILLSHAAESGADVLTGARVAVVDFDSDPDLVNLDCRVGARRFDLSARVVVDASGRGTLLGRQLGLKVPDPVFNQYAIHTWYEGLDRDALAVSPEKAEYIHVHFLPVQDTWMWQIPITETITSVGVVTQKKRFREVNTDRESFFRHSVAARPDLAESLERATRVRPFKVEADYSYSMKGLAGDRFVLIGDAARFVDPIFSSGVSVALNSARLAARDLIAAHRDGNDFSRKRFDAYETMIGRAASNWYEFISIYYRLNVLFTAFVQDPRYRTGVLKMLQGDFYEEEPPILADMRAVVTAVEDDPGHLWHPYLGSLRAGK